MRVTGNFSYLLIALIGFLALTALQAEYSLPLGRYFIGYAFEATMIVGIWSIVHVRKWFTIGMILVGISIVSILLMELGGQYWAKYVNLVSILLFYVLTTFLALKALLYGREVNLNKIMGSICVYLLAGISWGILYYLEFLLQPGAFEGLTVTQPEQQFTELLYYSYVTISTLGYGDITPLSPVARTLAYIEALFGQFYIAILVASFVGMSLGSRKRTPLASDRNEESEQP